MEQRKCCLKELAAIWRRCGTLGFLRISRIPFLSLYTMFQMILLISLSDDIHKGQHSSCQSDVSAPLGIPEALTAIHKLKTIFVIISEIFTFRCAHEFFFLMVQKHKLRQWHEPLQSCLSLHGHTFAKSKTKRPVPFKYMLDGPELLINVLKSQPRAHIFLILCVTE